MKIISTHSYTPMASIGVCFLNLCRVYSVLILRATNLPFLSPLGLRLSFSNGKHRGLSPNVSIPIVVLLSLILAGCSIPTAAIQGSLYSFTKKEKTGKSGFFGKIQSVTIKDFRENTAYIEDIENLKKEVEKYILQHPDLSEPAKNNLRELKVTQGFTSDEVIFLLGGPDKLVKTPARGNRYGATEIWIYRISKLRAFTVFIFPVLFVHEAYYLYFKDGALMEIERHFLKQVVEQGSAPGVVESKAK